MLLREFDAMRLESTGSARPPAGVVSVGASGTVSRALLAPLAAAFRGPPERVRLQFVEAAQYLLLEGLDAGRIDIALITTPEPVANCRMEVLIEDQLYLVAQQGTRSQNRAIGIADLDQVPLVMFPRPSTNRSLIERKARDKGFTLNCAYESTNAIVHLEFARLGLASSILPHFAFADHLATHGLIATPIKGLTISQTLVWRNDRRQTAIVAEVADVIRHIMRNRRTAVRNRPRTRKRGR